MWLVHDYLEAKQGLEKSLFNCYFNNESWRALNHLVTKSGLETCTSSWSPATRLSVDMPTSMVTLLCAVMLAWVFTQSKSYWNHIKNVSFQIFPFHSDDLKYLMNGSGPCACILISESLWYIFFFFCILALSRSPGKEIFWSPHFQIVNRVFEVAFSLHDWEMEAAWLS